MSRNNSFHRILHKPIRIMEKGMPILPSSLKTCSVAGDSLRGTDLASPRAILECESLMSCRRTVVSDRCCSGRPSAIRRKNKTCSERKICCMSLL
ncbi:ADM_HP2_G0042360.mRNA.1.CDS.1 [Saccharomyces cerevisiae]|nr:ADM_HP2_G0042360.mRNA.1.CDS.1 [Saccharomyces cerevisiae]CAI6636269.1 ADM_HP2_G0042360.mRNA.1.CDS.1 [Saccharomyces cerevisiae]